MLILLILEPMFTDPMFILHSQLHMSSSAIPPFKQLAAHSREIIYIKKCMPGTYPLD